MALSKSKKKLEREITVSLQPSVARDLITVLYKFSNNKMEFMTVGNKSHADRLLALNLFREDVAEALRRVQLK